MAAHKVQSRKPIHDRRTPYREQPDHEDEYDSNGSEDPITSNSDSELEENISVRLRKKECLEESRSGSSENQRPRISLQKAAQVAGSSHGWKKQPFLYILPLIVLLLIAIGIFWFQEPKKICSFEILKEKYPKEKKVLWSHLKVGIETILNHLNKHPAVYLFAHNGSRHAFNLIKDIAAYSSDCFGKKLIPMESDDFISTPGAIDDYGHAIEKYKSKIKEGNVILIANLNEIPAEAARALHTICDTYSPINKNVVIFLKLTIQGSRKGNANALAEETLADLWGSKLEPNELDPLITRVTDQVILLST